MINKCHNCGSKAKLKKLYITGNTYYRVICTNDDYDCWYTPMESDGAMAICEWNDWMEELGETND